jgi:sigma-B regulation protein RsbU (phosphoserine phosphatase)
LKYVKAGHDAPIVLQWKDNRFKVLRPEPSGTPLGLLEISHFSSQALQLKTGDVLVMYTDGITEAENPEREFRGEHRLESLLRSCRDHTPAQIVRRILDEVLAFANGLSQKDDVTLMVIGVKDEAGLLSL